MNTSSLTEKSEHDEIALLLPWYVNDSLTNDERGRVEAHVRSCLVCRRELALERRTVEVFRGENPVDMSAHAAFERLQDRIAHHQRHPKRSRFAVVGHTLQRFRALLPTPPRPGLRAALVALPMAMAVFAAVLINNLPGGAPSSSDSGPGVTRGDARDYYTLSQTDRRTSNINDVHVVFARGTDDAQIARILRTFAAGIVNGPDSSGAYTVRLSGANSEHERQMAIAALRVRSEVVFAEPAQPLAVPKRAEGGTQ